MDWKLSTEARINDILIRASKQVSERKSATHSGFRKLAYPSLNGDILNYLEFKKHWRNEVVPEQKSAALELAALRGSIPVVVKGKIVNLDYLTDAWKLLDLEYGDVQMI